ncbi:MAG TPA: ABC transporter ATP-binding protein [Candidatus Bathyarchaeia archaeon]|nr:ABC transporter ATP-binding protein [Candidatus Bathyarchaeia archaeon]
MRKTAQFIKSLFRVIRFCWTYSQKVVGGQIWLISFYNIYLNIHPLINAYFIKLIIDALTRINSLGVPLVTRYVAIILLLHFLVDSWDQFAFRHHLILTRILREKLPSTIEIDLAYKHASLPITVVEDSQFKDEYVLVKRESRFRISPIVDQAVGLIAAVISWIIASAVIIKFNPFYWLILLLTLFPRLLGLKPAVKKSLTVASNSAKFSRKRDIYLNYLESGRGSCEGRILGIKTLVKKQLEKIQEITIGMFEKTEHELLKLRLANAVLPMVGVFSISYLLLRRIIKGLFTIGDWQLALSTCLRFVDYSKDAIDRGGQLQESSVYIDKLISVLNHQGEASRGKKALIDKINSIEFKNVSFQYPNVKKLVLENVSFKVNPNENIAIVGHNGAGKTTLVKLLCRFYIPRSGQILVNGINIEKFNIYSYWRLISALFQDFETYGISAWESIGYGDIDRISKRKAIRKAARLTGIDKYLSCLPQGYDTSLIRELEGGVDLSIGQWQKVALARALFRKSKMIILDEPTSNMDPESEEEVFNKLVRVVKNRVMFLISHRFSTVKRADRIIVLESGRVIEEGNHKELMEKNGLYARLFRIQSESYKE